MGGPKIFEEILLVEDNPGDVRLTKEMLKEGEFDATLHVVPDGADALEFLEQSGEYTDAPRPDVILLDLHLARMDGEEVLAEMGDDTGDIPVVAISGSQKGAELKLADIEDDVEACLEKPIEPDELEDVARAVENTPVSSNE